VTTRNTLARLKSLYPSLTDAEQRVARTILDRAHEVQDWSGRDLARSSETTETVVFRLTRKLGLDGFKALKYALLREQAAEHTRKQLGVFNIPIQYNASVEVQTQEVLQAYVDSLQQTANLVDTERIETLAKMLREASLVTLLGIGSSLAVAMLAENVLLRCGINCRLSVDAHLQSLQGLLNMDAQVVIAFSYSGETRETVEAVETAHLHGAKTVVITAFEDASATDYADLCLMVPVVNPQRYRVGLVDAVLPYLMLLDILAIRITEADVDKAAQLRDEVEHIIQRRKLREMNVYPESGKSENDHE
jgi:DNA-binding MurR/RpiR family transcriptional regulator